MHEACSAVKNIMPIGPVMCADGVSLIDRNSNQAIGARFRSVRRGPEADLVDRFLEKVPFDIPEGCRATVFRELCLEAGIPDLVIVVWRDDVAREWCVERNRLRSYDLKVLQYLHGTGFADDDVLIKLYGRKCNLSVKRLYDAGLIRPSGKRWLPTSLSQSFAAIEIISIEAKVRNWGEVVKQAILNTWFASRSYVLVHMLPSSEKLADAQRKGIGVLTLDDEVITSALSPLPKSYASWMLNDLAWRSVN